MFSHHIVKVCLLSIFCSLDSSERGRIKLHLLEEEVSEFNIWNCSLRYVCPFLFIYSVICEYQHEHFVKVVHSLCQQIWKTLQWPQDWKRSVFIPIPKKGNAKECSNYHTTALISHANKIMRKILQAGFSCTWTENFQMYELNLEKAEKGATEDEMVGWHHWLNGH